MEKDLALIKKLLDVIPFSIWLKGIDGKFKFINKFFEEYYRVFSEGIIEKTSECILGIEKANEYKKYYKKVFESKRPVKFNASIREKFFEVNIIPIIDEDKVVAFVGVSHDITDRIKYENDIIYQKNLMKTLIDTIPDSIFYKDKNSVYLGCNKTTSELFIGKSEEEIIGKTDKELYPNNEQANNFIEIDKKVIEEKKIHNSESVFITTDGNVRHMESIKAPIIDDKGNAWGVVCVSRDITERKKMEYQLRKFCYTDKLTGLYNRAYFEESIKKLNDKKNLPFSIIMGDVNGLKIVNDTFGHLEGDKLLVKISYVVKSVCRKNDIIFRWGGDEIAILLPNTKEDEAEGICKRIAKACINTPHEPIPLSISLGNATTYVGLDSIDKLLKEAEDKLYRHKLLQHKSMRSGLIESLKKSLEEKSLETEQHTERIVRNAIKIGRKLELNTSELDELVLVASLHDIGKIAIPEEILMKAGELTKEEYEIMKTHTEKGFRIAQTTPDLAHIARGILTHHERWDGKGYPLGLMGEDIPLVARIVSVADAYDAMTNDRVYKNRVTKKQALNEIKKNLGTQFDPKIGEIFINEIS
ncbi:diguanylate cyclase [Clostridium carnis]